MTRGRRHEAPFHGTSSGHHVVHVRAVPPRHQGGLPREGKARPACKQMDEPVARDAEPGKGHPGQEARETESEFKRIGYKMQTIGEYKEYTRQLENEVGKWHHAYDALVVERNALVNRLLKYEKTVSIRNEEGAESVALLRETFDAISGELDELRKHEVEWDMAKARIKELESEINQLKTR